MPNELTRVILIRRRLVLIKTNINEIIVHKCDYICIELINIRRGDIGHLYSHFLVMSHDRFVCCLPAIPCNITSTSQCDKRD